MNQWLDDIKNKVVAVTIAWLAFACVIYIIIVFPFHVQPTSPYNMSDPSTAPSSLGGLIEAAINIPIALFSLIVSPFPVYLLIKLATHTR